MAMLSFIERVLCAGLALCLASGAARASEPEPFGLIESKPLNELWLNAGFYSYHTQRDKGLNDRNPGLGAEWRFSSVGALTAGRFYNSDRLYSNYAGAYYQPIAVGPMRLGLVAGAFDGYPHMKNGGWFLAAIPVLSIDYQRVGLNLSFVPSYRDRLYGAISFQLKFKLFDKTAGASE